MGGRRLAAAGSAVLALAMALAVLLPAPAYAGKGFDSSETAKSVGVNASVSNALTDRDDEDWYTFTTPSAGVVQLGFTNEQREDDSSVMVNSFYVNLYNADLEQVQGNDFPTKAASHPGYRVGLPAGRYYVKVTSHFQADGLRYTLTPRFTAASDWETELNDGIEQADPVAVNKSINGVFEDETGDDWYTFTTPSAGVVQLGFTNEQRNGPYYAVTLYDSNLNELRRYGFPAKAASHEAGNVGLPAGRYYVCVSKLNIEDQPEGLRYTLTPRFTAASDWETELNNRMEQADAVRFGSTVNGTLNPRASEDGYASGYALGNVLDEDWYRIEVGTNNQDAVLTLENKKLQEGNFKATFYDGNLNEIDEWEFEASSGSHSNSHYFLPKGTYYVSVSGWEAGDSGKELHYSLRLGPVPRVFTVTFNSNGGSNVATKTVTEGQKAARPADPKRSGYNFKGWYSDAKLTRAYDFNAAVKGNVTLYAKWEKPAPRPSEQFTDVTGASTWVINQGYLDYAVSHGLMTGYKTNGKLNGKFGPEDTLTRGQVAVVLYRVATGKDSGDGQTGFRDAGAFPYYRTAIKWLKDKGISTGDRDPVTQAPLNTFRPDAPITRQELATLVYRFAKQQGVKLGKVDTGSLDAFKDGAAVLPFAREAVAWCNATGIITGGQGADAGQVMPGNNATRAQAAKIFSVLHKDVLKK